MKKTITALLLTLLLLLSACGEANVSSSGNTNGPIISAESQPNENVPPVANSIDGVSGTPFSVASELYAVSARMPTSFSLPTGKGFYEILPTYADSLSILYTDFETLETKFLSKQTAGPFDNEGDTSYISEWYGGASPFVVGDNLYFNKYGVAYDSEIYAERGEEACGYIAKMKLDGTDRTKLITLPPNESIDSATPFFSDGQVLITMIHRYDSTTAQTDRTNIIVAINLNDGTRQDLVTFPKGDLYFIMSAYNDTLVMKRLAMGAADQDATGMDAAQQEFESQEHQLFTYTLSTGQTTDLKTWMQNDLAGVCEANYVAYWNFADNTFHRLDCVTGEDNIIATDLPALDPNFSIVGDVFDNHAIMDTNFTGPDGYAQDHKYAINIETGEFIECWLAWAVERNEDIKYDTVYWARPLLETAEHIIVAVFPQSGEDAEYAQITKTDFWAGNGNYKFIKPAYIAQIGATEEI